MASSNKTAALGLNRWTGADKPKMEDFNADNSKIDAAVAAIAPPVIGTYTGNDVAERAFTLAFQPSFGIVFAVDKVLTQVIDGSDSMVVFSAFFSKQGCSQGAYIDDSGFTVVSSPTLVDERVAKLNVTGVVYAYIMFR